MKESADKVRTLKYYKMHSLLNDFIITQDVEFYKKLKKGSNETWGNRNIIDFIRTASNRKEGIGCDQFIAIGEKEVVEVNNNRKYIGQEYVEAYNLIIYNSDGSIAANCVNGIRCVNLLLNYYCSRNENVIVKINSHDSFETPAKIVKTSLDSKIENNKALASVYITDYIHEKISHNGIYGHYVKVGNEHLVFFINENEDKGFESTLDYNKMAEEISKSYKANGINVSFANLRDRYNIDVMIVHERGAGETMACGSAGAAIYIAFMNGTRQLDIEDKAMNEDGKTMHTEQGDVWISLHFKGGSMSVSEGRCDKSPTEDGNKRMKEIRITATANIVSSGNLF